MKGNYYPAKWEMYFVARAPVCVRSRYIIQVIRDGNADIVTSIPLEKETPAALREWKKKKRKRIKRWKTLQTRLGVSGTDLRPRDPLSFFFLSACLIIEAARPSRSSIRSIRLSLDYPRWTIYSTARFREAVKDRITRCKKKIRRRERRKQSRTHTRKHAISETCTRSKTTNHRPNLCIDVFLRSAQEY